MAEDSGSGERTEEATQERRMEFRKRGQVAQTREVASVLVFLGGALVVWALGRFMLTQIVEVFGYSFGDTLVKSIRAGDFIPAMKFCGTKLFLLLAPLLGVALIISFTSTLLQVGFLYNEEALKLDFERINPVNGFQRIFALRSVIEGLKSLIKIIVIAAVVVMIIKSKIFSVPYLIQFNAEQIIQFVGDTTVKLLGGVGVFMVVVAGLDYGFQRWEIEKKMRMTKQEVKEEYKNREGDPMIRARIRKIQRDIATRRMMQQVPKADVIITNPTHIACAIKYDPEKYPAPVLIAKGADHVAEKIKTIARDNNIPIVENKPLARTIFKTMKLGSVIPRQLFQAVAEVLSYVYKLKGKVKK